MYPSLLVIRQQHRPPDNDYVYAISMYRSLLVGYKGIVPSKL